jgi:uncharacterized protein with HEPN domain
MPPDPRKYLWDAAVAAEQAQTFAEGNSFDDYLANAMLRAAVERQFEIIGEALNQLSQVDPGLASAIPDLPRIVALSKYLDPRLCHSRRFAGVAGPRGETA